MKEQEQIQNCSGFQIILKCHVMGTEKVILSFTEMLTSFIMQLYDSGDDDAEGRVFFLPFM